MITQNILKLKQLINWKISIYVNSLNCFSMPQLVWMVFYEQQFINYQNVAGFLLFWGRKTTACFFYWIDSWFTI